MTREDAKNLFRNDKDSYGKYKAVMTKLDKIFDYFEEREKISSKERNLYIALLEYATDQISNKGCNDVDEKLYSNWTKEERIKFVKEFHEYNGDPENFDEDFLRLPDFAILGFLKHKLEKNLL